VPSNRLQSGPPYDRAQDGCDDDRIIGVTEDRDEVRHEIDGKGQIGQEQREPYAHSSGQGGVGGQATDQAQHVGQQPQRLAEQAAARPEDRQRRDQRQPGDQQRDREPDQQIPSHDK
jgi:hypothetical protein